MLEKLRKNGRSLEPGTVYFHEKKVPYPYYMPEPHHHCEVYTTDGHRHMVPHYVLPLVILGTVLVFALLTLGLLLLLERARLTPVIRARLQDLQNQPSLISAEEILRRAFDVYNQLDGS